MVRKIVVGFTMVALLAGAALADGLPVYKDPSAPIEARVKDLLGRMTLEEKIAQLGGDPSGMSTPDNARLGIPGFKMSDGPNGVRWGKATCWPNGLALAATWDVDLLQRTGVAMGQEFRGKGRYVALGPCINLIRDPRNGRSFEGMGEDPYLTGEMAAAYIRGMQSVKCIAVAKHYACNNQENGRGGLPVEVNDRSLYELYLPHFRAVVQEGHTWGIMAAYNKVNGEYCAENRRLEREILKDEWGFPGFVVSDWGACHSTGASINAGLDVEMPSANFYGAPLLQAVKDGKVSPALIDDAVKRVLRAKFWAGVFEHPVKEDPQAINTPEHRVVARAGADESIVLLKNRAKMLPLDRMKIRTLAVIGPNAAAARPTGGGSAGVDAIYAVSPLEGIRKQVGKDVAVTYALGCTMDEGNLVPIPTAVLRAGDKQGLQGEYFGNQELKGEPVVKRVDANVDFDWGGGSPDAKVPSDHFSARWTGTLIPPVSGDYKIGTRSDDGARLWLNGKLVIDDWRDQGAEDRTAQVTLTGGVPVTIRAEYYENMGEAVMKLGWVPPDVQENPFGEAREAARKADAAIVCVGDGPSQESEGSDRASLKLPGQQDALIRAVAEANPRTIVVVVSGSAMLMEKWIGAVPAVMQVWFAGDEAGTGIADVLFGDVNPSGRLPLTLPVSDEQLPSFDANYETPGESRGYRYYDGKGLRPEFPFGYGLSYTQFLYGPVQISDTRMGQRGSVTVNVAVRNVGARAGDEVVQLYVHDAAPRLEEPVKELKGFRRLHLGAGQSGMAEFKVTAADLAYYDPAKKGFVAAPGKYEALVGASARQIKGKAEFELR